MSESVSDTVISTPGAAEPGPTPGTQAPVAETVAAPAPVSSPEPVATEVVAEPVTEPTREPSILSDARSEVVPEVAPEPVAEPVKEPEAAKEPEKVAEPEVKKEEPEAPKEPAAPPVYEDFKLPDGVTLADEKVGTFKGLLSEAELKIATDPESRHTAMQEFGQKLMDLYVSEMKENIERAARFQRETWDSTINDWKQKFRDDPEIGKNRQQTTLQRSGALLDLYGQQVGQKQVQELRDILTMTGAGDHPEMIRFVNWAAGRLTETPRIVTPMMPRAPVRSQLSPAQRLYKNTPGAA